jgi:hypothetical protein
MEHPYEPHADDLVAVEVVFPAGVHVDGKVYAKGQTLTVTRGHALAQNRPVYRILRTVRYVNGPPDQAEDVQPDAPLEIRPDSGL